MVVKETHTKKEEIMVQIPQYNFATLKTGTATGQNNFSSYTTVFTFTRLRVFSNLINWLLKFICINIGKTGGKMCLKF